MALRGSSPTTTEQRPKILLFGEAGVGKTTAALQFPAPYVIDAERGTTARPYAEAIVRSGGAVFHTTDADEMIEEVRALHSERHDYRTLVLDPITTIYDDLLDRCSLHGEEWGRHYREANKVMKRLRNLLFRLDMAVIVTAHGKVEYGEDMRKVGTTFDGWRKLDFIFDLVIELTRRGKERWGRVRKNRYPQFMDGEEFRWTYDVFRDRFGPEVMERPSTSSLLASVDQLRELDELFSLAPVDRASLEAKWLRAANTGELADMRAADLEKCIAYLGSLIAK